MRVLECMYVGYWFVFFVNFGAEWVIGIVGYFFSHYKDTIYEAWLLNAEKFTSAIDFKVAEKKRLEKRDKANDYENCMKDNAGQRKQKEASMQKEHKTVLMKKRDESNEKIAKERASHLQSGSLGKEVERYVSQTCCGQYIV